MGGTYRSSVLAAGQVYKQTVEFVYFGAAISADWDLTSVEGNASDPEGMGVFRRYIKMEVCDRPGVRIRLKVRMLKADGKVMETLLYGRVKWSPSKADHDRLRKVHNQMLLRCFSWQTRTREDHTSFYANASRERL